MLIAHAGAAPAPHDVWTAWSLDPVVIALLAAAVALYRSGRTDAERSAGRWRGRAFGLAVLAVAVALLSPLDAVSTALASAHMVQHLLLVLVAAPLFALAAPAGRMLRAAPATIRRIPGAVRRRLGVRARTVRRLSHPLVVLVVHVVTLWVWHAAVLYDAALTHPAVHVLEHLTFLVTAVWFWRVVLGGRGSRVDGGLAVLLVFGASMASVLLGVLLTFARAPWYEGYLTTTDAWGLSPLLDQQLAGAVMWVPAGAIYVIVALRRLAGWLASEDTPSTAI